MRNNSTILIVDDSPTQLAVLRDALEDAGYEIVCAVNGMDAIAKVYSTPPALILSDIMMPELNGYHLCRLIKDDPRTAHIPIILLTSLSEPEDRFWGQKAGADSYLDKNSPLPVILATVKGHFPESKKGAGSTQKGVAPAGFSSGDIQARLTSLLDRSLFESTITNEVLKLNQLAHSPELLAAALFDFLPLICRFSAAILLLPEASDKFGFFINAPDFVSGDWRDRVCGELLNRTGLNQRPNLHFRDHRFPTAESGAPGSDDAPETLLHHLTFADGNEILGALAFFGTSCETIPEHSRHTLEIIADRLHFVLKYLKKNVEIEEVKANVVSMLVHDMRTPLTSIRGFTDLLVGEFLGALTKDQTDALRTIQGGCDRLLQLIEDILDLSRLEAGKMQISPAPISVQMMVHDVIRDFSVLLREKDLALELEFPETPLLAWADEKQLNRVLSNLIGNAVKFAPPGSTIRIAGQRVACRAEQLKVPPAIEISVSDHGPGISPEQQTMIFNRFQQFPALGRLRKGTGLGLAICKEIIDLHGSDIWVESPLPGEDHGSRFSFTVPEAGKEPSAPSSPG